MVFDPRTQKRKMPDTKTPKKGRRHSRRFYPYPGEASLEQIWSVKTWSIKTKHTGALKQNGALKHKRCSSRSCQMRLHKWRMQWCQEVEDRKLSCLLYWRPPQAAQTSRSLSALQ